MAMVVADDVIFKKRVIVILQFVPRILLSNEQSHHMTGR